MVLNQLTRLASLGRLHPDKPAVRPPHSCRTRLSSIPGANKYNSHLDFGIVAVRKEFAHLTSRGRIPPDKLAIRPPHTGPAPRCSPVNHYESGHCGRPGASFESFQPSIKIPVDHFDLLAVSPLSALTHSKLGMACIRTRTDDSQRGCVLHRHPDGAAGPPQAALGSRDAAAILSSSFSMRLSYWPFSMIRERISKMFIIVSPSAGAILPRPMA
jgi:hypothetical protein